MRLLHPTNDSDSSCQMMFGDACRSDNGVVSIIDTNDQPRHAQVGGTEQLPALSALSVTLELVRSRATSAFLRGDWELAAFWEEQALLAEPATSIRPQRLPR